MCRMYSKPKTTWVLGKLRDLLIFSDKKQIAEANGLTFIPV